MLRMAVVHATTGAVVSTNDALLVPPAHVTLARARVEASVADHVNVDGTVDVTVTAVGAPALYVVLTTTCAGRFSRNGLVVVPSVGAVVVQFVPWEPVNLAVLAASVRVDYLAENL